MGPLLIVEALHLDSVRDDAHCWDTLFEMLHHLADGFCPFDEGGAVRQHV